jgi:hypothetical protein
MKNLCGKVVTEENAYEVWATPDRSWRWYVLRKYASQATEDKNPYARWLCKVYSPFCPDGEMGDTYISDIKRVANKIK